jgi:hypothetical protein
LSNKRPSIDFKEHTATSDEVSYEAMIWKDYLLQHPNDWQNSHFQDSPSRQVAAYRHTVDNITFFPFKSLKSGSEAVELKLETVPNETILIDRNCIICLGSRQTEEQARSDPAHHHQISVTRSAAKYLSEVEPLDHQERRVARKSFQAFHEALR